MGCLCLAESEVGAIAVASVPLSPRTGLWFPSQVGSEGVHAGRPEGRSGVACPIPAALASKRIKDKTEAGPPGVGGGRERALQFPSSRVRACRP